MKILKGEDRFQVSYYLSGLKCHKHDKKKQYKWVPFLMKINRASFGSTKIKFP